MALDTVGWEEGMGLAWEWVWAWLAPWEALLVSL